MNRIPEIAEVAPLLRALRPFLLDPASAGEIRTKNPNDFVSAADLAVQSRLAKELAARFPSFAFLGEEGGTSAVDPAVPTWVLDPVDGTTNFIFGYGHSAVSLALVRGGASVLGLVYNPYTDELFAARRGEGAWKNGQRMQVSPAASPAQALAIVGTTPYCKQYADELFTLMRRLYLDCIDLRRSGSAALDLCYIADGRAAIFAERSLKVWDFAAGALILTEAGGTLTDWQGDAVSMQGESSIAASNCALHPYLLRTLRESASE